MLKDSYAFIALFSYEEDGISIDFPDLPGCCPCADKNDTNMALRNAREALGLHIWGMEQDGKEIPVPSDMMDLKLEPGQVPVVVEVFMPPVRKRLRIQLMKENKEKFEDFVSFICDICFEKRNDESFEKDIQALEQELKSNKNCRGEVWFNIFECFSLTCPCSLDIDFGEKDGYFYAEYYDGCQAPFRILQWKADKVDELFGVMKDITPHIYANFCEYESQKIGE